MAKKTAAVKKAETVAEARVELERAQVELTSAKQGMEGKAQRDDMSRATPEWKRYVAADQAHGRAKRALAALEKSEARAAETMECQVCERHQKTRDGNLVHHGYQRPGWGMIVGDCYGAGYAPFPAHDRLDAWLTAVEASIKHLQGFRAALDGTTSVTREEKDYASFNRRASTKSVTYTLPTTRLDRPTADYDADRAGWSAYLENRKAWEKWESVLAGKKRETETQVELATHEASRVRARIELAKASRSVVY